MRVGIAYIVKIHSKANNKYTKCYDSSKESKFVVYLDEHNLYGSAVSYRIVDLNC